MSQTVEAVDHSKAIAKEIQSIVKGSIVTVLNPVTIQIDNHGVISSVRIREARKGSACDFKITHGGKSQDEDTGAKIVGEAFSSFVSIKDKAILEIASQSTDWDINNISQAHVNVHNYKRIHEHPTIHWASIHNANGKVGISVQLETPNAEDWIAMRKTNAKSRISPAPVIPSGKIVFKIISEEDIDFTIENDRVSIQGTIAQVDKVIARITGNPFTDW